MIQVYTAKNPKVRNLLMWFEKNSDFLKRFESEDIVSLVVVQKDIKKADYIMIPHNYHSIEGDKEYIRQQEDMARKYKKKIIVFTGGDYDGEVKISNAIVVRASQYKTDKKKNEIILSPMINQINHTQGEREYVESPVIGFCGWAEPKNIWGKCKVAIFNLIEQKLKRGGLMRRKGISIRGEVIRKLQKAKELQTNFIIRKGYLGSSKALAGKPNARKEYEDNIVQSDLSLAIKGDGNYSIRFFEILSAGRIPVLIDTDCVLPLEDEIDYDEFIMRIPYKKNMNIEREIMRRYRKIGKKKFAEMQHLAKTTYWKKLHHRKFYERVMSKKFLDEVCA